MGKYGEIEYLKIEKLRCPKCNSKLIESRPGSTQHLADGSDHHEVLCRNCNDGMIHKIHFFPKGDRPSEPCPDSCPCRKYQ